MFKGKQKFDEAANKILEKLNNCFKKYDFNKLYNDFISEITIFFEKAKNCSSIYLESNNNDLEKAIEMVYKDLGNKIKQFENNFFQEKNKMLKEIEDIRKELQEIFSNAYEVDSPNLNTSNAIKAYDSKTMSVFKSASLLTFSYAANFGAILLSVAFPPVAIVAIPFALLFSFLSGWKIGELFDKGKKFKEAMEASKTKYVNEFTSIKNRFNRDFNKLKNEICGDSRKILGIAGIQYMKKSKKFYEQLRIDYLEIRNNINDLIVSINN